MSKNYTYFDLETNNAGKEYGMEPEEFVRIMNYAVNDGEIKQTTDVPFMREVIRRADYVIGHNIISADLPWLFGQDSMEPLEMALQNKVIDTFVLASLLKPAPYSYTNSKGHTFYNASAPEQAKKWLSLDNLCYQFGLEGKFGDLAELAKKHNPPKTLRRDLDFGLIPLDDPDFLEYARQDVIAVRSLYHFLVNEIKTQKYNGEYIWREMIVWSINAQISKNGVLVDIQEAQDRVEELAQERDRIMEWLVGKFGFPTTGKQPWKSSAGKQAILDALKMYGITPSNPLWTKTASGAPSFSGDVMKAVTEGTEAEKLGESLAILQGQRSLAQLALESVKEDGRAHPSITSLQRSGRACLPETHKILTKRGILHVDEVRVGDETLDMRNRWVKITNVVRYKDAPVHRYENDRVFLESTPEHRWIQTLESRGSRTVEPIDLSKRRTLQLTPDAYPFDAQEMYVWKDMTERERTAFLVGLLVTDGHASNRRDSKSLRFYVYQTEHKFYREMKEFLGDLVTNDYSRPVKKHPQNIIHEMSLKTKEVSELLQKEGLDAQGGLRHSDTLLPWLLTLSQQETVAFLTAAYMSDGTVASGTPQIATLNPNMVQVLQIAAYRAGRRSNYRVYENPENYQTTGRVALTRDRVTVRTLPIPEVYYADVWCVETETGTFTAWNPEGRWSGPYLTGNSTQRPGLTVWTDKGPNRIEKRYFIASPGHKMVEMDYSNADQRVVAAYSGDVAYKRRFDPGVDGHEINGRLMFGDEVYDSDPKKYRDLSKAPGHAYTYGASPRKLASTSGLPVETMERFVRGMEKTYPLVIAWQNRVREEGESGVVENDWGRRMPVDPGRSWTQSPAMIGQSGTREIMMDGLISIARADMSVLRYLVMTVHDAVVWDFPENNLDWLIEFTTKHMTQTFKPKHPIGQEIEFTMTAGKPGDSWLEAGHG